MRNLISLATGSSHELYVYMIDQRGHLQKKRSCRWKGEKEGGGERERERERVREKKEGYELDVVPGVIQKLYDI